MARQKAGSKGAKPRSAVSGGGRTGSTRRVVLVALAALLPVAAVASYVGYHASPGFRTAADRGWSGVQGLWSGADETAEKASDRADTAGSAGAGMPLDRPPADVPPDRGGHAAGPKAPQRDSVVPPARGAGDRAAGAGDRAAPSARGELPRQERKPAVARVSPMGVKAAQGLVRHVFGGRVADSRTQPGGSWYSFSMEGSRVRKPLGVAPGSVSLSTTALQGRFSAGADGFVVALKVHDPSSPEWTNTYVGALHLAGTPEKPGKVLGATAMQAPGGRATRCEAVDLDSDGLLEVLLEVESEGPGGYLFRDLGIHSFSGRTARVLFETRTLDDGPGVPTESASFRNVSVRDVDRDGEQEIVVEEGLRTYAVADDMTRTLTSEKITATRTWRKSGHRYRIADKG